MAVISSVQNGTASVGTGTSVDVTVSAVDLSKTFLAFGHRGYRDSRPDKEAIRGKLTTSTNIHFERDLGGYVHTIEWYVVEFSSGVAVQRGSTAFSTTDTSKDETISAVTLANSFPFVSMEADGATWTGACTVVGHISTTTNLHLETYASGVARTVDWEVIDYTTTAVQYGLKVFWSTATTGDVALSAVDLGKTWVTYSYEEQSSGHAGRKMIEGYLIGSTVLRFTRYTAGAWIAAAAANIRWYAVEHADGVATEQGSMFFGTTAEIGDAGISAVDLSRTMARGGYSGGWGRSDYPSDTMACGTFTLEFTTTTNLRGLRGNPAAGAAQLGWYVVEFPGAVAAASLVALRRPSTLLRM